MQAGRESLDQQRQLGVRRSGTPVPQRGAVRKAIGGLKRQVVQEDGNFHVGMLEAGPV